MLKPYWIFIPLMLTASAGFSQSLLEQAAKEGTVVSSSDPAIVAEVERKAAEIVAARDQGAQQSSGGSADATSGASSESMPAKPHKGKRAKRHAGKQHAHPAGEPATSK